MTDRPFLLLTQDDCPSCERLKKMLAGPLKGQFDDQIEVVHRQSRSAAFEQLATQHSLRSVPALIRRADGAQLRETGSLAEVKAHLARPAKCP